MWCLLFNQAPKVGIMADNASIMAGKSKESKRGEFQDQHLGNQGWIAHFHHISVYKKGLLQILSQKIHGVGKFHVVMWYISQTWSEFFYLTHRKKYSGLKVRGDIWKLGSCPNTCSLEPCCAAKEDPVHCKSKKWAPVYSKEGLPCTVKRDAMGFPSTVKSVQYECGVFEKRWNFPTTDAFYCPAHMRFFSTTNVAFFQHKSEFFPVQR